LDNKAPDAFRTISEVADDLDLPQHVLRFWESRFREIKPMKRGGGRRYYRPDDVDLLRGIRHLLYGEGYTIRGVQRILREQGVGFVQAVWQEGAPQPPHGGDNGVSREDGFADEMDDADALDEPRGLRGRVSSLIGRDLGDHGDAAGERREPPLQSAPVPHIDRSDRAIFEPEQAMSEPPVAGPKLQTSQSLPNGVLAREQVRKLQAALDELTECRKLLDSAVARAEP
jgi:DNA-binding transcriptional MerR regulator